MSPKIRQRKQRGIWEADFIDAEGNRHRPTAMTRREAEKLLEDGLAEKKRAQERKHGTPLADDPMTFPRYVDRWLSMLTVEKKTLSGYRQYARLYLNPKITKRVGDITPADINDLLNDLRQQYAPATVRQAKSVLTQALSLAVVEGYLASNPVKDVQRVRSKSSKPKIRVMSHEQLARLLKESNEPYRTLFAVMASAGLRPSEAYALERNDIDLEAGIIRVERSISIHDQSVKGTKTGEERPVELSDQMLAVLKTHLWINDTTIRKTGFVFTNAADSVLDHNGVAKVLKGTLKRAKLPTFSLYDLRHTFASLLLSSGAPLLYVQKQMGHSLAAVTLKYYSKWMPRADEKRHVNLIDLDLEPIWNQTTKSGSPGWTRTNNLRINSPSLHQLSYRGMRARDYSTGLLRRLGQVLQDELGDCLECVEDADPLIRGRDRLEHGLVVEAELRFHFFDGKRTRQVAFVQLKDVGQAPNLVALSLQVLLEVSETLHIRIHALALGIGNEDDAVHTF